MDILSLLNEFIKNKRPRVKQIASFYLKREITALRFAKEKNNNNNLHKTFKIIILFTNCLNSLNTFCMLLPLIPKTK